MSITEVPVLPFRASRHLAAWIVWHTSGVSLIEDMPAAATQLTPAKSKPARRRKRRRA
jgi:hypothetical protein